MHHTATYALIHKCTYVDLPTYGTQALTLRILLSLVSVENTADVC